MATVNIRTSKRGTTIHLKAGKGEDLRGFIEAMLGQPEEPEEPQATATTRDAGDGEVRA